MIRDGLAALVLLAAAPAAARPHPHPGAAYADPADVIAAELAFARAAKEKGQWTAFRDTAAPDAVMFVPQMVLAQAWLKGRADPPVALGWAPSEVWSSCDGSLMLSHGLWSRGAAHGWFSTLWRRDKNGGYKWIFDHGDDEKDAAPVPEMISAHIADCPKAPRHAPPPVAAASPAPFDSRARSGASDDGTLTWEVTATANGAHNFSAEWRQDGAMAQLTIEEVAAPEATGTH